MAKVWIETYNPNWAKEFIVLKKTYKFILKEFKIRVEHVGSTSVEGLDAKPILDIDIIMEDEQELTDIIEALEKVGYKHVGDMGIVGREAFERLSNKAPFSNDNVYEFNHHLYVCKVDSTALKNHLLFRDYLRTDNKAQCEYARLKRELAIKFSHHGGLYCEAKTDFITSILEKSGLVQAELQDITTQNTIIK